ncbi:23S rRNA (adenine(2503)-C(2))-methyltransferase RlmN [Yeguia hominis]|uniref:Probable dual-specificity RNA methyltransferase RlmN n=1 Tax=Yeguia hominis TaxID=2763662 RepID=A0A926D7T9_9FIRM|nr:23S rRNA (adenine(2503)-C(2))-methyltransferase RlmN [Yeguia hominis]MBC8533008.1 23S rRNA (adenine(2503)-C(2))-methyltransferase RlmN [Yeguia hominis]
MLKDIKSMTLEALQEEFSALGQPRFRAGQVYRWLQQRGVSSFEEMTDLPGNLRAILREKYYISVATIEKRQISDYDNTRKYLLRLLDGEFVECVLMEYHHGLSVCISTQIGCKMGCTFCATGKSGFSRNLTASEILSEVQTVERDSGQRISNIVLMGMGEPLDNYENVMRFLSLVSSADGMNIGMRHISLSTCGLVDQIYRLADEKLQLTLSVSLHAPNDAIRSKMMPVNRKWNVETLLKACRYYADTTKRRISFEYAMIDGVNDSGACARELAGRLRGILSHVNLIPVNTVDGAAYRKSGRIQAFQAALQKYGVTATVRRTLGEDIDAACGQLRRRAETEADLSADL